VCQNAPRQQLFRRREPAFIRQTGQPPGLQSMPLSATFLSDGQGLHHSPHFCFQSAALVNHKGDLQQRGDADK
jgi:hypothetical protein